MRVHVESLEPTLQATEGLMAFVVRTRRELEAAGHQFRTGEEIDRELRELRAEWEDRSDRLSGVQE